MPMAANIERYLSDNGVRYGIVTHQHSETSFGSALAANLVPDKVAKGVLLRENGQYALAVLPASRKLDLDLLRHQTGRPYRLARESEVERVFHDCAPGAVPALGSVYGLATIVESSLREQPELYLEAGDHEELIHLTRQDYETLPGDTRYCHFARLYGIDREQSGLLFC